MKVPVVLLGKHSFFLSLIPPSPTVTPGPWMKTWISEGEASRRAPGAQTQDPRAKQTCSPRLRGATPGEHSSKKVLLAAKFRFFSPHKHLYFPCTLKGHGVRDGQFFSFIS